MWKGTYFCQLSIWITSKNLHWNAVVGLESWSLLFRKTKKCRSTQPIHHLFWTFIYCSIRIGSMLISRGDLATTFLLEKKRKVLGDILNMDMLTRQAQLLKNNHNNNKLYFILFSCIIWFNFKKLVKYTIISEKFKKNSNRMRWQVFNIFDI